LLFFIKAKYSSRRMTIKHLVFSGGGPIMIQILAALQELEAKDFLHMSNIETIYGTSAGAIVATLIALKFDWDTINDYIIKRPWQDVFPIHITHILDSYGKRGIFDHQTVEKCFKPLLDAKDIPIHISLLDFYHYSNIEIHMFAFDINQYKTIDISHVTFPELPLLTAIQMSCALPVLMAPVCMNNMCIMDGGVACNYPLNYCIESGKKTDEILGFKNKYSNAITQTIINEESTLFDYILGFIYKAIFRLNTDDQYTIEYEVECDTSYITIELLQNALSNVEVRRELFDKGISTAQTFLQNRI